MPGVNYQQDLPEEFNPRQEAPEDPEMRARLEELKAKVKAAKLLQDATKNDAIARLMGAPCDQ